MIKEENFFLNEGFCYLDLDEPNTQDRAQENNEI